MYAMAIILVPAMRNASSRAAAISPSNETTSIHYDAGIKANQQTTVHIGWELENHPQPRPRPQALV